MFEIANVHSSEKAIALFSLGALAQKGCLSENSEIALTKKMIKKAP